MTRETKKIFFLPKHLKVANFVEIKNFETLIEYDKRKMIKSLNKDVLNEIKYNLEFNNVCFLFPSFEIFYFCL